MWLTPVLYGFSMVLQVAALVYALRMVWQRLPGRPWLTLALGMFLMLAFRAFGMLTGGAHPMWEVPRDSSELVGSVLSMGVTVSIFISIVFIQRAELRLGNTERRLKALFDNTQDAILLADDRARYVEANAAAAKLTGYSVEELLRMSVQDVTPIKDEELALKAWQEFIAAGRQEGEFPILRKDETIATVDYRAVANILPGLHLSVLRDTTQLRAFQQELREAVQRERAARLEAEQSSGAKDEFIAVLSHELRTPLTPVLLAVSLIESHPDLPESLREDVTTVRRNVELESRLIGDLLDHTRIVRGKLQMDFNTVDVHQMLQAAIDICQRDDSVRLTTELQATQHFVSGDATRLQQIFWNLINNAQKFTDEQGSVTIRTSDVDGRVRIDVIDTGEGIDPQILPRLFNAFEQGETRTTRQFAGLGLGLAISRRLVEAHGGTIAASSPGKGQGATFSVELPAVPAPTSSDHGNAPQVLTRTEAGLRILLVEDHESTARALARLLRRMGHEVTPTHSFASATAAARSAEFDLLLSDVGLPDGSGLDLMRSFREKFAGRSIALTGYGMEEDVRNSREAGFAAHLTKPIDFQKLKAAIDQVIGKS